MSKNILFVVAFPFPHGSASSARARNLYKLFLNCGYKCHIISDFESASVTYDEKKIYDYEAVYSGNVNRMQRWLIAQKVMEKVKKYCDNHNVDVIVSNAYADRVAKLTRYCKNKHIELIVENCEWYDISDYILRYLDYRYHRNEWMLKHVFRRVDAFISISRFLDDHKKSMLKKSVRIPTIIDMSEIEADNRNTLHEKIKLIYAGNPGTSKEFLKPVVDAIGSSRELRQRVEFHVYGPNMELYQANVGDNSSVGIGEFIFVHGKIDQKQMTNVIHDADFMVFLRPDRRSSNAGFPTKFAESYSVGTPVITNITGDIGLYLKDGYNGFVVSEDMKESLENILNNIMNMTDKEYTNMRKSSRETALKYFDLNLYQSEIKEIIGE